jgi:hypothetical protein
MAHLITFTTARFDISKEPSEPDAEDWGWYIHVAGADGRIWWAPVGRRMIPVRQSSGQSKCIEIDR